MDDNGSPDSLAKKLSWLWFVLGGIALFIASVLAAIPEGIADRIPVVIIFGGVFGISLWRIVRTIGNRKTKGPARKMGRRVLSGCLTAIAIYVVVILGFTVVVMWITPPDRVMKEAARPVIEALSAYHGKAGRYPAAINDLVPEYLPAVPGCKPGKAEPRMRYFLSAEDGEYTLLCTKFVYQRQRYSSRTKTWDTSD